MLDNGVQKKHIDLRFQMPNSISIVQIRALDLMRRLQKTFLLRLEVVHSGYDLTYKSECNFEFSDGLEKKSIGYCLE